MRAPALLLLASALAAADPPAAQVSALPPVSFAGGGKDAAEQRQLDAAAAMLEGYRSESREFSTEVSRLIRQQYRAKRDALGDESEKAMRDLEQIERKERLAAIAKLEEFLQRYPNQPVYTPEVIFRLAELDYERATDDHQTAMRAYERRLQRIDPTSTAPPPSEPEVDYGAAIALYQRLVSEYPAYAQLDAAWYLLGYCLEKQDQFEDGLEAYRTLIARYPKSRFVTEAWMRIGEWWFDSSEEDALARAADAYEHAVQDRKGPLYDKALYKLGWTYFRMDRFDQAVDRFLTLADAYGSSGELRQEALQYVAVSLTDDRWGSLQRATETFTRRGTRPYEGELYRKMGDLWLEQTHHAEAIAAYRLVLHREPFADDAPRIQERLVEAYQRDRKLDEAFHESEVLAETYGPGSKWWQRHQGDPDALASVQDLAERSLYGSAVYHHQQALALKTHAQMEPARQRFAVAATAYGTFLTRFPRSKTAYEAEFYEAECLYNAERFAEAARHYDAVRDSTADLRFKKEASLSAVLAWRGVVEMQVRGGKLPVRRVLRSQDRAEGSSPQRSPLAETEKKLVAASDAFLGRFAQDEQSPSVAYKAAELFYLHDDFPEARRRFAALIHAYPASETAKFATNLTVESFLVDKDWKSVEEVSGQLAQNAQVIDPKSDLYRDLVKFKLAGRFKRADELMQQGAYDEAAQKYVQLVDEQPANEFADKALNNAAVACEKSHRFESAMRLYERIVHDYPDGELAGAALFRVAVNAENSYDFDRAVKSYDELIRIYPDSKDREAALFNAARLLEGQQRYTESAQAFGRYAELFPDAEDAGKNLLHAAAIYEKMGDAPAQLRALQSVVKTFSRKSAHPELLVEAQRQLGSLHARLGHEKDARAAWEAAVREFDRQGLRPEKDPEASESVAQARFQLAELELRAFDRLRIGGRGKVLERSFTTKRTAVKRVSDAYGEVFKAKRLEWTLAALYRRGYALERFGATILETPVPPEVKRIGEEAVAGYQDQLQQQTAALEDKAVESYIATLAEARKNRISNTWTRATLEALNGYRPKEYPVLKAAKGAIAAGTLYPQGMIERNAPPTAISREDLHR